MKQVLRHLHEGASTAHETNRVIERATGPECWLSHPNSHAEIHGYTNRDYLALNSRPL